MVFPAGASLAEFRLRVGFVHFPVPQSHHRLLPDLQRLSASVEMVPWRIGGEYDRPIPRRIVEEAGIPRELFAVEKKAITQIFHYEQTEPLRELLSPRSFQAFSDYVGSRKPIASYGRRMRFQLGRVVHWIYSRVAWRMNTRRGRRGLPPLKAPSWVRRFRRVPTQNCFLVHWGVDRLLERYR
jgi:hypothetical protein